MKTISILKVALGVAIILTLSILFYFYHKQTAIALDSHAANSFFSEYIVPLSGSGITNKYTDYDIKYGIDDGETIVLHVIIKNLMTVNKNTIHHNNSKTLISYSSNIYTDKYLKYISEDTIKETREKLKNIYCASGSFHKLSPQERLFYEARKQRKSIILHYYADSGETLIFNIGVSPESC